LAQESKELYDFDRQIIKLTSNDEGKYKTTITHYHTNKKGEVISTLSKTVYESIVPGVYPDIDYSDNAVMLVDGKSTATAMLNEGKSLKDKYQVASWNELSSSEGTETYRRIIEPKINFNASNINKVQDKNLLFLTEIERSNVFGSIDRFWINDESLVSNMVDFNEIKRHYKLVSWESQD
jgi:hypothetical protein